MTGPMTTGAEYTNPAAMRLAYMRRASMASRDVETQESEQPRYTSALLRNGSNTLLQREYP